MKPTTLSALTATLALLSAIGLATSAQASMPPVEAVRAPMSTLFVPRSAQLTPAGERWLAAQVALHAQRPATTLVVALPGPAGTALQQRRAHTLRERIVTLGVAPGQVFFEAGAGR